jgi:hypothetical protein
MADKPVSHTPALSAEEIDRLASKRAGSKLGWFIHAAAFTGVNLVVFAMSKYGFGERSWSIIPFLGWGVGLALHGVSVWVLGAGGGLRERMVQKERERLQREQDRRNTP